MAFIVLKQIPIGDCHNGTRARDESCCYKKLISVAQVSCEMSQHPGLALMRHNIW